MANGNSPYNFNWGNSSNSLMPDIGVSVPDIQPMDFGTKATLSPWQKFKNTMFGTVNEQTGAKTPGMGGDILGGLSGLANAWLGMKQYGLAKDALKFQKKAWQTDYNAQKTLTNADLNDRQNARYAANPNAYESPASYMAKNEIK